MAIGKRIKFFRTSKSIPQRELGGALGFPFPLCENIIEEYENGTRIPPQDILIRIAEIMTIPSILLIDIKDKTTKKIMEIFWSDVQAYWQENTEYNIKLRDIDIKLRDFELRYFSLKREQIEERVRNAVQDIEDIDLRQLEIFNFYRNLLSNNEISFEDYIDVMNDWQRRSQIN